MKKMFLSKAALYLLVAGCLLLPTVFLVGNQAFGYGGGGIIITPPTPDVPVPVTPNPETPVVNPVTEPFAGELPAQPSTVNTAGETAAKTLAARITTETSATIIQPIVNFIAYGTANTLKLGSGERAGVVNSYQAAFNRLPTTSEQWNDVVKIANGRWPKETSTSAETKAKVEFKKIYLRDANMANPHDNAAVTVISYGLRPAARNLASEKAAIKSFKAIYKYAPTKATHWDIVRSIAYSGATR
jgi:hypothetical protein